MARENMSEWDHDVSVDVETIRAIVEAYAEGKIDLREENPPHHASTVYNAPGESGSASIDPTVWRQRGL